jgi:hypothetical protein
VVTTEEAPAALLPETAAIIMVVKAVSKRKPFSRTFPLSNLTVTNDLPEPLAVHRTEKAVDRASRHGRAARQQLGMREKKGK